LNEYDPHYQARETLTEMAVQGGEKLPFPSPLPRMSETPGQLRHLGPELGAANAEVYKDLLGLSDAEMKELKDDGVI